MAIHINELNEMFVVEWNARKNKLQVRVLGEMLKNNLLAAVEARNSGYVPVAIAHTEAEALEMSKLIAPKLKNSRLQRGDSLDTLG
jgi:hypothetical protein